MPRNFTSEEEVKAAWDAEPWDIHYRSQLVELGVRVTEAMEEEAINSYRIQDEAYRA